MKPHWNNSFEESTPFKTFAACPRPYHHPIEVAKRQTEAYRASHPEIVRVWSRAIEESLARSPTSVRPMLYPSPNGGKRILPSIYTKLRDTWLRASGFYHEVAKMDQGHLRNSVDLLNESHVNLVDRMCLLLGKMHVHLGNRPDLQTKLVELHHEFEALEVNQLYPIVELLASHIEEPRVRVEFEEDWLKEWYDEIR